MKGFAIGKVEEGSPPPAREMLKGEERINTLLPLVGDTIGKTKGLSWDLTISWVTPPEIVEASAEAEVMVVASTNRSSTSST